MIYRLFTTLIVTILLATGATAKQVALIIGNTAYQNAPALKNPQNDAREIDRTLRGLGFETTLLINASLPQFAEGLGRFEDQLTGADAALFFFAGHGMQMGGENYLLGVEASVRNQFALDAEAMRLSRILDLMEERATLSMAFIDACRDNPLANALQEKAGGRARSLGLSRGLAPLTRTYRDTLVAYATSPGAVAYDGTEDNSPFSAALLKHINTPGIEVSTMLKRVTGEVWTVTNGAQQPQIVTQMSREFYFNGTITVEGTNTAAPDPRAAAREDLAQAQFATARRISDPVARRDAFSIIGRDFPDTTAGELAALLAKMPNANAALSDNRDVNPEGDRKDFASLLKTPAPEINGGGISVDPAELEKSLDLSRLERIEIQRTLNAVGFFVGSEDGVLGRRSREAIKDFQKFHVMEETGYITQELMSRLAEDFNAAPGTLDGTYELSFRRRWDDAWHRKNPDPYYKPGMIETLAVVTVKREGNRLVLTNFRNLARVESPAFSDFRGSLSDAGRFRITTSFNYLFGKYSIIPLKLDTKWPTRFKVGGTFEFEQGMYDPAFHANILVRRIN